MSKATCSVPAACWPKGSKPVSQTLHPEDALLNEYLDGSLPPLEQANLQTHLSACATCVQRLEVLQAVFDVLAVLPEEPLELDLSSAVRTALQPSRSGAGSVRGGLWVLVVVEAGLSLVLLILTGQPQIFRDSLLGVQQGAAQVTAPLLVACSRLLLQWQSLSHLAPDLLDQFMAGIRNFPLLVLSAQTVLIGLAVTSLIWLVVHVVFVRRFR
jgi:hypothetical protein